MGKLGVGAGKGEGMRDENMREWEDQVGGGMGWKKENKN